MDPLAHSLFGAALARTRLGRDVRLGLPTLVVAANLPDVDVVAYFAGSDAALALRRGWTHGPLGLLLLPLAWLALVGVYERWRAGPARLPAAPPIDRWRLLGLAYLGVLSHPLLDWLNTYGVRLLMPFERQWFYGDVLFIVDPWMWLLLGAAAALGAPVGPWSRRLWVILALLATVAVLTALPRGAAVLWLAGLGVVAWRGRRSSLDDGVHRRTATVLVALFGAYLLGMVAMASVSKTAVRTRLEAQGVAPLDALMVGPVPGTPFAREVVAATPDELRVGEFRWWGRRLVLDERSWSPLVTTLEAGEASAAAVGAAVADPCIAGFVGWMRFPTAEVELTAEGTRVHLLDLRYTRQRGAAFGAAEVPVNERAGGEPARPPSPP